MSAREKSGLSRVAALLGRLVLFTCRFLLVGMPAVCIFVFAASPPLWANPAGGNVTAGSATITSPKLGVTTINQSTQDAIINWNSFSIAKGELTQFNQPNSSSITLNRVILNDPSVINGQLSANGQVWLVNPNGVFFGPNAKVDVQGILATTADIANNDFMAGKYKFSIPSPNPSASVVNQGTISIRDCGLAGLVAPHVRNDGIIQARLGEVVLGGAPTFTLDFNGDGLIQFQATSQVLQSDPNNALVTNTGSIKADGGAVLVTARAAAGVVNEAINVGGVVEAQSVSMKNGAIVLDGGDSGTVSVTGTLDASGVGAGQTGGKVTVTGENVGLLAGSVIDASGNAGGGQVNIGGGEHGADPNIQNANAVYMDPKASISADATGNGNGGNVVLWSQNYTNFQGAISAQGGPQGGNGGQVETSSHNVLDASGSVNTLAPYGKVGDWLLDPSNITIDASLLPGGSLIGGVFNPGPGESNPSTITPDTILAGLATGNVTIATSGGTNGQGDITLVSSIVTTSDLGATRTLTLQAYRDIIFDPDAHIDATHGGNTSPLNVVLWSNFSNNGGSIVMNPGTYILSNGGNITFGGGSSSASPDGYPVPTGYALGTASGASPYGIYLSSATINAEYTPAAPAGSITLMGQGVQTPGLAAQSVGIDIYASYVYGQNITMTGSGAAGAIKIDDTGVIADGTWIEARGDIVMTSTDSPGAGGPILIQGNSDGSSGTEVYAHGALTITGPNGVILNESTVRGDTSVLISAPTTANGVGIQLDKGSTITSWIGLHAGGEITLATSGPFTNNSGPDAFDIGTGGTWLVYSADPRNNTPGGLIPVFIQYNAPYYIPSGPTAPAAAGDGFLYSLAPVINVSLAGTVVKQYDGTRAATLVPGNYGDLTGVLTDVGDSVTLSGDYPTAGTYDTKNVGTEKLVSVALSGFNIIATNGGVPVYGYQLGSASGNIGTITTAPLTISSVSDTKTYDATTAALGAIPTYSGLMPGDSITGLSEVFGSKNAGTWTMSVNNGYTINDGNSGNNYNLTINNTAEGTINRAPLTISSVSDIKTYDATTAAPGAIPTYSALMPGDSITGLSEVFDSQNAGTWTMLVSGYTINDGNSGHNYTVTTPNSAMGTINQAPLVIDANNASREFGEPNPIFSASFSGFQANDNSSVVTGLNFSTIAGPNSQPGQYEILPFGATAENYQIQYVDGTLTITPSPLGPILRTTQPVNDFNANSPPPYISSVLYLSAAATPDVGKDSELLFVNDGNLELWSPSSP